MLRRECLAALLLLACAPSWAQWTESVILAPIDGTSIEVTVYRPAGPGRFPLAVISHGSPRNAAQRRTNGRQRLVTQSEAFLAMGYAVIVPTRRGYGRSGGDFAEDYGRCTNPDYAAAGLETARDIRAAVDAVRSEPWIDAKRIVLVGQSAGGWGSVAASSAPLDGLVAVVNFAGGRGSHAPDDVCTESHLVEAMARYGAGARVPQLWIYSENDHFFAQPLAHRMHDAFVRAGGKAEWVTAPPVGDDGHLYFSRKVSDWEPRVRDFLKRVGVSA
jgi:dienelactone hydrolase